MTPYLVRRRAKPNRHGRGCPVAISLLHTSSLPQTLVLVTTASERARFSIYGTQHLPSVWIIGSYCLIFVKLNQIIYKWGNSNAVYFSEQFLASAVEGDARRGDFFAARVNFFGFAAVLIFSCRGAQEAPSATVASKAQRGLEGNELIGSLNLKRRLFSPGETNIYCQNQIVTFQLKFSTFLRSPAKFRQSYRQLDFKLTIFSKPSCTCSID